MRCANAGGHPIRIDKRNGIAKYILKHPKLFSNRFHPYHPSEFRLAQTWLKKKVAVGAMDEFLGLIHDAKKPNGTEKFSIDEVQVKNVNQIRRLAVKMPEHNESVTWKRSRLVLSDAFQAYNALPDAQVKHVFTRKNLWKVAEALFGNPRFSGFVHTRYTPMVDQSSTRRNPATGEQHHPRVHGEMFSSDWWREEEVFST